MKTGFISSVSLQYLGQEGFLLRTPSVSVLCDPYLTDYVDRISAGGPVLWKRLYPAPVSPGDLTGIDYIFCSHAHEDHADPETLSALAHANPDAFFAGSPQVARIYREAGIDEKHILIAHAGESISLGGSDAAMPVPAAHEELHRDENGDFAELGFRFVLNGISIYHAGDCCIYDGLTERLGPTDVCLLPVNGRDYFRLHQNIIGNMDGKEAILLAKAVGAKYLIPMHYDLYAVNRVSGASFTALMEEYAPDLPFHLFRPGEKMLLPY